jgi:hypothetical protein
MRTMYKNLMKTLPSNKPQCYETANCIYNALKPHFSEQENATIDDLYNLKPSFTVIEIHISLAKSENIQPKSPEAAAVRKKYNIKNGFWIPRVFNHSFNVFIRKKFVYIAQSWFRVSNYKIKYKLTHPEFIEWLNNFKSALNNYNNDPEALFNIFKYFKMSPNDQDTRNLILYIKEGHHVLETELEVKTLIE